MHMELINPIIEEYSQKISTPSGLLLHEIHSYTMQHHSQAHMLSSEVQGRFLALLSALLQPAYILEIGTFVGYSALCLSEGLQQKGELHTIELREETAHIALENFKKAEKTQQIHLHIGNAKNIVPTLPFEWDLVFIDADKTGYIEYYNMALERLATNGLIIVDNVLFHGKIFEQPVQGKSAKAIAQFNEYVATDERVQKVLLTIRDGLLLIKKKP